MIAPDGRPIVLGLHVCSQGFGWAAFADPFTVYKHGVYRAPADRKSSACLKKAKWLLGRINPEILVLEAFDEQSGRAQWIRDLCIEIVGVAAEQGVEITVFRRGEIQEAFRVLKARTREDIAEAVARQAPALAPYLPKRRQAWDGEDRRQSRFCAAALVLTHYHFEAHEFFEDLRKAA